MSMVAAAAPVSRAELVQKARQFPVTAFAGFGTLAALIGAAAFVRALAAGGGDGARAWQSYHFNFMFWTGLAQGLVVFAATQKLSKGHWSGVVIRFAEAAVAFLAAALVLYVGLFLGRSHIFTWLHEPRPDVGPWLTEKFFFLRNGLILVALAWLSWRFVRHDMTPDRRELALMALAVLTIFLRRRMGLEQLVSEKQLHDLGKLCFGFTVFWGYLMWAQYLVIWYGNLPEETYFIFYRLIGPWRPVGAWVFVLVFLIPFVGLLGVKPKRYPPTFLAFALVSLVGIWLERYLEVVPSINGGAGPAIGVPEIGVTLFFGGLFLLSMGLFAARFPMISPRLALDALERERH